MGKGKLPMNPQIIYNLQDIFNLLPNQENQDLVKSFATETNDMMLAIYLGSIIRATLALHNLINNNLKNKNLAEEKRKKKEKEKEDKQKEKEDKEKEKEKENEKKKDTEKDKEKEDG